jgi:hypothetical protein
VQDLDLISLPALHPDEEELISGDGIRIELAMYPLIDDLEFMKKARDSLACKELVGITPDEPPGGPLEALLINEPDKGCGLKALRKMTRRSFAMWYVGNKCESDAAGPECGQIYSDVEIVKDRSAIL